jgi:hypothetical protein
MPIKSKTTADLRSLIENLLDLIHEPLFRQVLRDSKYRQYF